MQTTLKYLLIFITFTTLSQCIDKDLEADNSTNDGSKNACDIYGVVHDRTGLDGCKWVIELEDGTNLEPVVVEPNYTFKDGETIHFSYVDEPAMSICMIGQTVRITCIDGKRAQDQCGQLGNYIEGSDSFDTLAQGDFVLNSAKYADGNVMLDVGYSGCSPERDFALHSSNAIARSLPPQRAVKLLFTDQPCEAWFTQNLCFPVEVDEDIYFVITDRSGESQKVLVKSK